MDYKGDPTFGLTSQVQVCSDIRPMDMTSTWGFPKIGGTLLGVLIISTVVFLGL